MDKEKWKELPGSLVRHYQEKERRFIKDVVEEKRKITVVRENGSVDLWVYEDDTWWRMFARKSFKTIIGYPEGPRLNTRIDCEAGYIYLNFGDVTSRTIVVKLQKDGSIRIDNNFSKTSLNGTSVYFSG